MELGIGLILASVGMVFSAIEKYSIGDLERRSSARSQLRKNRLSSLSDEVEEMDRKIESRCYGNFRG